MNWLKALKDDTWVKPFFAQYRSAMLASLGLGLAALVFACGLMFVSGYLIDLSAERPELGVWALFVPLGFVQLFGIGKPFLSYFERLKSHDWVLHMTSELRRRLFEAIDANGVFWSATRSAGEMLGLLSDDIGHLQNLYLRSIFPQVIACILWLVLSVVLGVFTPLLGLATLLMVGVLVAVVPLVAVAVNGARQIKRKQMDAQLYEQVYDNVLGAADWAFAQRGDEYVQRTAQAHARKAAVDRELAASARRRELLVQVLLCALFTGLLLWAAGHFAAPAQGIAAAGDMQRPADWLAAFALGFFPLAEAFVPLSDGAVQAAAHMDSTERLNAVEDEAARKGAGVAVDAGAGAGEGAGEEASAEADAVASASTNADAVAGAGAEADARAGEGAGVETNASGDEAASTGGQGSAVLAGNAESAHDVTQVDATAAAATQPAIELRGLHFAYPGETREALRGIDLVVRPGEKVAVLGPSGSGKSTLLSLVRGDLAPTSGDALVFGASACSLADGAAQLMGVIQQETYLFNATLFENLALEDPQVTRERAQQALERVGLSGLLDKLPDGLDTMVDEAGLRFSGGERHRIALARVLLQDAPIVLLDEPCASLDPMTEAALLETLFDVLRERTVVLVTHHLLGVHHMDRVVFVEDGTIGMQGTPAELEKTSERYQRLLAFDRG